MLSKERRLGFDLLGRTVGAVVALGEAELLEVRALAAVAALALHRFSTLAFRAVEAFVTWE